MKFKILNSIHKRLKDLNSNCHGALYGILFNNTMIVTQFCVSRTQHKGVESYLDLQAYLPSGVDFCGVFTCGARANTKLQQELKNNLKDVQISDNPLFLNINDECDPASTVALTLRDNSLVPAEVTEITSDEFLNQFVFLRLIGIINFDLTSSGEIIWTEENKAALLEHNVFHLCGTDIFLACDESYQNTYSKVSLSQLSESIEISTDPRLPKGLFNIEFHPSMGSKMCCGPTTFKIHPKGMDNEKCITATVDALGIVDGSRKVDDLFGILADCLWRQSQLFSNIFTKFKSTTDNPEGLRQYHFYPQSIGHFFTLILPDKSTNIDCRPFIEYPIAHFGLAKQIPLFEAGNRLKLSRTRQQNTILFNVHKGVKPSGIQGGKEAVVNGFYSYHHYMQDGINDDGWGCAYRSFQTLFSWFRWNGYTDKDIPSVLDIQECLVSIGDKKKKFIGSREWIGSAEVGYCLDSFLGVTCINRRFDDGEGLKSSAEDLFCHFTIHGTPIMIGGGSLAHTILGIHYNEETGEVKFLILDPHYTGVEDLKTIQSKGWVGWKGMEFWKKSSFYNMCIPLRPHLG